MESYAFYGVFTKSVAILVTVVASIGCISIEESSQQLVGVYRWGSERDNAEYLTLKPDGTYLSSTRSDSAVDQRVQPFVAQSSSGHWIVNQRKLHLIPIADRQNTSLNRTFALLPRKNGYELKPVLGAGWSPPVGFLRE